MQTSCMPSLAGEAAPLQPGSAARSGCTGKQKAAEAARSAGRLFCSGGMEGLAPCPAPLMPRRELGCPDESRQP